MSGWPSAPGMGATAPSRCQLAVVGGGILGLAVARELVLRHPRSRVCVLEREDRLGAHQTGHNSGVIHAGIYYAPGSLKARLCVQGAREMYEYCERHGVAHERCGKLIVASAAAELPRLDELERRGRANAVPGLRRLGSEEISALEPHVRGAAALHSPLTGIVDFAAVARALAQQLQEAGAQVLTGCGVHDISASARSIRLSHRAGQLEADYAVFCAGAWADRLAVAAGARSSPRIVPFRGAYLRLVPWRRHLVRALVYPVPDPALPFLGVHLTRRIDGEVLVGPTALLAPARDAYALRQLRARDLRDTLAWPGTWRLMARWWRTGATELHHALRPAETVRAAQRFVPELRSQDVTRAFAGLRAQAVARDGSLVDDFVFSATDRALHVRNAPSPGATSSLALARLIADRADHDFGLTRAAPGRPRTNPRN
jgi:(S)-2-hydroxyglutarate dehydrogenase